MCIGADLELTVVPDRYGLGLSHASPALSSSTMSQPDPAEKQTDLAEKAKISTKKPSQDPSKHEKRMETKNGKVSHKKKEAPKPSKNVDEDEETSSDTDV